MGKYIPLQKYFEKCPGETLKLTFEQIERILGDKLPMSAFKYPAWWANGGHYFADSWMAAGWRVDGVKFGELVTFKKAK